MDPVLLSGRAPRRTERAEILLLCRVSRRIHITYLELQGQKVPACCSFWPPNSPHEGCLHYVFNNYWVPFYHVGHQD